MGGREPLGKFVYLLFVTLLVSCYLAEQIVTRSSRSWSLSGCEWILASAVGLLLLQLARLPSQLLARISPFQSSLLPRWSEPLARAVGHEPWQQISMTPHETWLGLGVLVAHAALFLVLVQRFQQLHKIESALKWIAIAALSMASIGLLQYLAGTEKYVWLFEHESRPANLEVCGPYSNSNHYAHFLALGIGPLVWWLQRFHRVVAAGPTGNTFRGQQNSSHAYLAATLLATGVVAFAGLLAHSRGGMLVMGLAATTAVAAYVRMGMLSSKASYGLAAVGVLVVAGLAVHGYRDVANEVQSITAGTLDSIDQAGARRKIWQANLSAIQRFPMLGTGVGSHMEIYPRFFPHATSIDYTHAESGFLQVLTETGIVGFGLLICGWVYCGVWCWRGYGTTTTGGGPMPSPPRWVCSSVRPIPSLTFPGISPPAHQSRWSLPPRPVAWAGMRRRRAADQRPHAPSPFRHCSASRDSPSSLDSPTSSWARRSPISIGRNIARHRSPRKVTCACG